MVTTPWGNASELREKKLRPGRGAQPEETARSQRRRLFAAMVATVAEKGYEATRVEDLVALSGVSRSTFYRFFEDKEACFLAAIEALIGPTIEAIDRAEGQPLGEESARQAFEAFVGLIVSQPAAARMCFVEIYAAGPEAVKLIERGIGAFEAFTVETLDGMPGRADMPRPLVRAMIGGLQKVVHTRLYRGTEDELRELVPQLWDWGMSYLPPPDPLRRPRRRQPPRSGERTAYGQADRVLRGLASVVAEKGYPETTIAEIVERGATSHRVFYENFENKEAAMLAALDAGSSQMLGAILPAFRRAPDWPRSVRASFEAMFSFAATEPDFTQLGAVEVYAAGRRALEQRDEVMRGLEGLLAAGYERTPEAPAVAAEAIGGAIYAAIYDQVKAKGPESLPEIAPLATYLALAPFLGAEEAVAVANGG